MIRCSPEEFEPDVFIGAFLSVLNNCLDDLELGHYDEISSSPLGGTGLNGNEDVKVLEFEEIK